VNIIFRSWIFDFLYIMADQLIKEYNPCKIYKDAFEKIHCMNGSPCCSACGFLGPDGCTTKCLSCKLALCPAARDANEKLGEVLVKMRTIACRYGLAGVRMPREEILGPLRRRWHIHHDRSTTEELQKEMKALINTIGESIVQN